MPISVFPPSHRDTRAPQGEHCQLCGLLVPGHDLVESDVEGLRGLRICSFCHDGMRDRQSYEDRRRLNPIDYDVIGTGRVYPPGGQVEFWSPPVEGFSPAHITRPLLWLRNFQILQETEPESWPGGLAYTTGAVAATGTVAYTANPFATGAHGLRFLGGGLDPGGSFAIEEPLELAGVFTIALSFRTGSTLGGAINLLHAGLLGLGFERLEIAADGSLVLGTASGSYTLLPASSFQASTNYLLVLQRDSSDVCTPRLNGVAPLSTTTAPGTVTLSVLHDPATAAVVYAELVVYEQTLTTRELACLENYLGGYVGVEA